MKILFEIAYIGSAYHGFQVQPTLPTVQGTVQRALEEIYGMPLLVSGCSRTDAGVHARQFFLTAECEGESESSPPPSAIPFIAPRYLPSDIAVISAKEVDRSFHVRYDVKYKEYRYVINNARVESPFDRGRAFFFPSPLDEDIMNRAASLMVGEKDFSAYMAQGSPVSDTVRDVKYCRVEREGDKVTVIIAANGFLYNMVRIISGTLLDTALGKIKLSEIEDITRSGDRKRAGRTLPPEGLYLYKVVY